MPFIIVMIYSTTTNPVVTLNKLLTREELANLLGLTPCAVEGKRKRLQIPYVKISRKNYRYDPEVIASLYQLTEEVRVMNQLPLLMTIKQVADYLAVTEETVRGLIKRCVIKTVTISAHSIRIKRSQVQAFIRSNSVGVYETAHRLGASA